MFVRSLLVSLALTASSSAFAWEDKTYVCRLGDGVTQNTYKIETVRLGTGVDVPYLEVERQFAGGNGTVRTSTIRGIATVSSGAEGSEILMLGTLRIEFRDGELLRCRE